MRIVKSIHFDAAHYLSLDSEARPYQRMHGHSFRLEVEITGEPDEAHHWVADFGDVTDALSALHEKLDHRLLNEVEGLGAPTLENICLYVARELKPQFPGLTRVTISRPSNGEACHYDLPSE